MRRTAQRVRLRLTSVLGGAEAAEAEVWTRKLCWWQDLCFLLELQYNTYNDQGSFISLLCSVGAEKWERLDELRRRHGSRFDGSTPQQSLTLGIKRRERRHVTDRAYLRNLSLSSHHSSLAPADC